MDHTTFPRQLSLKYLPPVPPHDAAREEQNERKHANDQLNVRVEVPPITPI